MTDLSLVDGVDEEELTDEEVAYLYGGPILPRSTITLATSPFFAGAPFEALSGMLPMRGYFCYILRDYAGDALYVGQTGYPRNRLRVHWGSRPWINEVASVELIGCADETCARSVELVYTYRLQPLHSQVTAFERAMLSRREAAEDAAANGVDL